MIAIAMILFFAMILAWLLAPTGGTPEETPESAGGLVQGEATA